MQGKIIGLFSYPWNTSFTVSDRPRGDILRMYSWAVWYKANPRTESYMRDLFQERYPQGEFVNIDQTVDWQARLGETDIVVLLYPDAIGLGFTRIESLLSRLLPPWAAVRVLNGRKREFLLSSAMKWGLRFRRLVERTMLLEWLLLPVFLATTIFLVVYDGVRGRT